MSLGKQGEQMAKKYLELKGYALVIENYRFERAEIDLIVKDEANKVLVFVEVKTRKTKSFGEPQEAVHEYKQLQLIKSAEGFMMNFPEYEDYEKRFDIVAIYIEGNKETINHLENAF